MHHAPLWLDLARGGRAKRLKTSKPGTLPILPYLRLLQDSVPWITGGDQAVRPSGNVPSGRSWKLETSSCCGITSKFQLTSSSFPLLTLKGCASSKQRTWMVKRTSSQGVLSLPPQLSFPKRIWSDSPLSWTANPLTRISTLTNPSCATPIQTAKINKNP